MAKNTNIQWTDDTLNALLGCFMCSLGCFHCYAIGDVWRMAHNQKFGTGDDNPYVGLVEKHPKTSELNWTGRIRFLPDRLYAVLRERQSRLWFVNSLSDLFYERLPEEIIQEHFKVFRMAYWHQFQALTKRSERLVQLSSQIVWPDNLWMGVSVERTAAMYRIADLGKTGARVKFISFEPWQSEARPLRELYPTLRDTLRAAGIHWAIIGGESSKAKESARTMSMEDVRYLIEECQSADVKVFLKQLGTRWAVDSGTYGAKDADNKRAEEVNAGGNPAFWPDEFRDPQLRQYPAVQWKEWRELPSGVVYPTAESSDWKKWATPEMERAGNPKHTALVQINAGQPPVRQMPSTSAKVNEVPATDLAQRTMVAGSGEPTLLSVPKSNLRMTRSKHQESTRIDAPPTVPDASVAVQQNLQPGGSNTTSSELDYKGHTDHQLHEATVAALENYKRKRRDADDYAYDVLVPALNEIIARYKQQGRATPYRLNGCPKVEDYFNSIGLNYSTIRSWKSRVRQRLLQAATDAGTKPTPKANRPDSVPHLRKSDRKALVEGAVILNSLVTDYQAGRPIEPFIAQAKRVITRKRMDDILSLIDNDAQNSGAKLVGDEPVHSLTGAHEPAAELLQQQSVPVPEPSQPSAEDRLLQLADRYSHYRQDQEEAYLAVEQLKPVEELKAVGDIEGILRQEESIAKLGEIFLGSCDEFDPLWVAWTKHASSYRYVIVGPPSPRLDAA